MAPCLKRFLCLGLSATSQRALTCRRNGKRGIACTGVETADSHLCVGPRVPRLLCSGRAALGPDISATSSSSKRWQMRMQRLRQQARDCQHQRPHTLQPRSAPRTAPSAPSQRNSISPLCCAASPSGVESAAAEPQTHAVLSPPAEAELHPSAQLASQSPDPQGNESPCQPSESSSAVASPTRRATCAAAAAVALQAALPAQPAQALKTVSLPTKPKSSHRTLLQSHGSAQRSATTHHDARQA